MTISKHIRILVFMLFPAGLAAAAAAPAGDWIAEARASQQSGAWTVTDKTGKTVLVEGELISRESRIISSGAYREALSSMADVMQVPDWELATSHPLIFLNPLVFILMMKMLFQGKQFRDVLYDQYIDRINDVLSQENNAPNYIFTASELQPDGKKILLGIVMFDIDKDDPYGTVGLGPLAVTPEAQGRGISKILSSSIFKFLPETNRIILEALCSNAKAIGVYKTLDFTQYEKNNANLNICLRAIKWYHVAYEYLTDRSQKLQAVAATFVPIE